MKTARPASKSLEGAPTKLVHVALWTRNIEIAAQFWREYFDADVGAPYHSARRPGFVSRFVRLADGPEIELMSGPWVQANHDGIEREGWAHVAVSVGSEERVRAMAKRLSAAGLLIADPRRTGDGFYEALARSPDGTLVEVTV